jgi:hypothetical protein
VTIGTLYDACRSTANPGAAQLTGSQILQFLREALKPDNMQKLPNGLRGAPIGMPHVSGMSVRYNPARLDALEAEVNREALQPERLYRVAASDMELSDFIGYLTLPTGVTYNAYDHVRVRRTTSPVRRLDCDQHFFLEEVISRRYIHAVRARLDVTIKDD